MATREKIPAPLGMRRFMFATGIEGSYPTISTREGRQQRIDEFAKCGHYQRWREDFELVKHLGIPFLRYGPPYFKVHIAPGQYDWSFADETLTRLKDLEITVIADLCHFGVPDWLESFQNPDFPKLFAEYAGAFAERFPWIRLFTPVNEIMVAARFSALDGLWNECMKSDAAFLKAVKHLCQANLLAQAAILKAQPEATFIQSECTEYYHKSDPDSQTRAEFLNERRFLALDLSYGYPINSQIYDYLLDNGMTRKEYHWFHEHSVKARCIMGNDYYISNEHLVLPDGSLSHSGEIFGYYVITRQYYDRYHLPVMHTETNIMDQQRAPHWLQKEWANMHKLKLDGVPVLGFTWYSLTDQVDWDTALAQDHGQVNPLGLFDLNRKIRPVGRAYKELIARWQDILPTESFSLNLRY